VTDTWKVQLWLGSELIEEHVAPTALAEQYANVIRLRIQGLPDRHLRCERVTELQALDTTPPRD
jgi:hypothetical protein